MIVILDGKLIQSITGIVTQAASMKKVCQTDSSINPRDEENYHKPLANLKNWTGKGYRVKAYF